MGARGRVHLAARSGSFSASPFTPPSRSQIVTNTTTKVFRFNQGTTVAEAIQDIRERSNEG